MRFEKILYKVLLDIKKWQHHIQYVGTYVFKVENWRITIEDLERENEQNDR